MKQKSLFPADSRLGTLKWKYPIVFILIIFTALPIFAQKHKNYQYPQKLYKALRYRNIGPYRAGRSIAVAGVISKPHTFYFGATGGGLWKSVDAGVTWKNVSDKFFKTGSVGAIAVAPSDPNVVYVGMGESAIRGDMAVGDGMYKSTDGGKTWQHVGLSDTHVISRIAVDPNNPDIVYVAALGHVFANNKQRGIYRSTDGGKTWKKILYVDDKTGGIDIEMDPNNPRVLFAAMWESFRKPWIMSSGGKGSGLYKSTDGGDTWKNISHNPGMPKGLLGKIGVSVSHANPNRIYALIEAKKGGVYRSDDGGKTWQRLFHGTKLTQRSWYYTYIFADPKDANTVYATDLGLFKSVDGGNTFQRISTPHGDNHDMWINPNHPDIMIESNDGGANVSLNGGETWTRQDQATGQFYHVAVDNRFPYRVYGPQQDDGAIEIKSRTTSYGITRSDWQNVAGGESGYIVPNPAKPYITYGGSYIGLMTTYNERSHQRHNITIWPLNTDGYGASQIPYRFNWTFPIMVSKHDPNVMYAACQYVFKSTNGGMSWTKISPDLTRNDKSKQQISGGPITRDETGTENYDTIFNLAESPVKEGVLWSGSDDGLIYLSKDGGKTWKNVTPNHLPPWTKISIIDPSHFDVGTAYVAARRYKLDDFEPYLYKTTDFGKHWKKITNGIAGNQTTYCIRQDTKDKNLLFAGTDRGVWVSFNDGNDWQPLQLNLPHVPVRDMKIQNRENDLVLATHGRAFWIMDNLKPLRQLSKKVKKSNFYLFQPEHAYLMNGGSHHKPGDTYGQNPPNGLVVFYNLKNGLDTTHTVNLTFLTTAGDTIRTYSNKFDAQGKPVQTAGGFYTSEKRSTDGVLTTNDGMNRFVWNLRYPEVENPPNRVLGSSGGTLKGAHVVPGTYKVSLSVDGKNMTQTFTVRKDPRIEASQSDLEAEFQLLRKIHKKQNETAKAINQIIAARKQINGFLTKLNKYPEVEKIRTAAQPILHELKAIQDTLYQKNIHNPEDDLNYPVKLYIKLASLDAYVQSSFDRPPKQMYDLYKDLSSKLNAQFAKLKPILNEQVPKFNQMVKQMQIPAVYAKNVKK
ncbi:MAG TPA: YCF48-related protein [Balneolales bacterium]|nr:YCF48-related protein [Balneolales bacterium]